MKVLCMTVASLIFEVYTYLIGCGDWFCEEIGHCHKAISAQKKNSTTIHLLIRLGTFSIQTKIVAAFIFLQNNDRLNKNKSY